jgi:hypothetical protein
VLSEQGLVSPNSYVLRRLCHEIATSVVTRQSPLHRRPVGRGTGDAGTTSGAIAIALRWAGVRLCIDRVEPRVWVV